MLPVIDLDAILVSIRAASSNEGLEVNTICPSCDEVNNYSVNLSGVLSNIKSGDYGSVLNLGELKIKFRPLNYKEVNNLNLQQTEMQRLILNNQNAGDDATKMKVSQEIMNKLNELTFDVVSNCIELINSPAGDVTEKTYIMDFLKNCGRTTFEDIKNKSIALREVSESKPLKIKCPSCSHDYEQPFTLNVSDFFA